MNILAHTSFIGDTGYNNHARCFFTELNKHHNVKIRNYTIGKTWSGYNDRCHDLEPYLTDEMRNMLILQTLHNSDGSRSDYPIYGYKNDFEPDIHIVLNDVGHYYFYEEYTGVKIAYTVWESTEYPKNFVSALDKFDQVWVPTTWQKTITKNQGIYSDKIYIVPEGVDGTTFSITTSKPNQDKFRFILVGRWEYRKSTKEILRTFQDTFRDRDDVELICSVENPYSTDNLKTTQNRFERYEITSKNIKSVGFLNRGEYIDLIKNCNVFVSCARSEGWNLPLIEAMACGIPSIYSNWGGQIDFANNIGVPVNVLGELPANISNDSNWSSDSPGNFCEPNFSDLSEVLTEVYNNYKTYKKRAISNRNYLVDKFSWLNAVKSANEAISDINLRFLGEKNFGMIQVPLEFESALSFLKSQNIHNFLEIGTDQGGTFYCWCNLFDGLKISVDIPNGLFGSSVNPTIMNRRMKNRFDNVHFIHGDSTNPNIVNHVKNLLNGVKLDFIFIDGDHTLEGVMSDFVLYNDLVRDGGWIGFHDIKKSDFHVKSNCFVGDFWDLLDGDKIEFISNEYQFGGIGLIKKNGKTKIK